MKPKNQDTDFWSKRLTCRRFKSSRDYDGRIVRE